MEKNLEKNICITVHLKLTQHCKSTILQYKVKIKKKKKKSQTHTGTGKRTRSPLFMKLMQNPGVQEDTTGGGPGPAALTGMPTLWP